MARTKSGQTIRIKQQRELMKKKLAEADLEEEKRISVPFLVTRV